MISQKQKMKMQQKLTPQQLLLMRLLQLPVTSLEQRIKEEVEKNPMLEIESEPDGQTIAADGGDTQGDDDDFSGIDIDDYYEDDDDYSYREQLDRDRNTEERQFDPSEGENFSETLLRQLGLHNLDDRQRAIAEEIIGSIDSSGYLGRDPLLIANDLAFRAGIDVSEDEILTLLQLIQTFDPAGVGARSLQECLSLQLHRRPADETTVIATTIVDKYFNQLSNKHYDALLSLLKTDRKTLDKALNLIRRLNPKPGWGRGEANSGHNYIIPDFIVSRDGGILSYIINDHNTPRLRLNNDYTEMMKTLDERDKLNPSERDTLRFIKEKSESAQWFIDTLQQRQHTLGKTMEAILRHQKDFFLSGDQSDMRPMKLKDISEATGFDESTISRIANQKYVQTDFGTLPIKELFSKAIVNDQGDLLAVGHMKEAILDIVDHEDKQHPLTDEELATELRKKGYNMSRRTVTKYRERMGIPVGRLRKKL